MRKTIKRVKVQAVNHLTRQARFLRTKKGKPEQLEKNRKRCDRLIAEVQAVKDWQPDDVTYAALARACNLVDQKRVETARERVLDRLIHHKLFVKQFNTFKDLVTPELLQVKAPHKEGSDSKSIGADDTEEGKTLIQDRVHANSKKEDGRLEPPSPASSPGSDVMESGEDSDDGESFFLPSKGKALNNIRSQRKNPNTSLKPARIAQREEEVSERGSESVITSSEEDEEGSLEDDKRDDRTGPMVDLPNVTNKRNRKKHIPGISAPRTLKRTGKVPDDQSDSSVSLPEEGMDSMLERRKSKGQTRPLVDQPNKVKKDVKRKHIPGISAPRTLKRKGKVPDGESDSSVDSPEEKMDSISEGRKRKRQTRTLVDQPNNVKKDVKMKHIPGISAPRAVKRRDDVSEDESDSSFGLSGVEMDNMLERRKGKGKNRPFVDQPNKMRKDTQRKHFPGISAPRTLKRRENVSEDESDSSVSLSEEEIDNVLEKRKRKGKTRPSVDQLNKVKKGAQRKHIPPRRSRREERSDGESDSSVASDTEGNILAKRADERMRPLVDLPYLIKKETKKKHIPGISAPETDRTQSTFEGKQRSLAADRAKKVPTEKRSKTIQSKKPKSIQSQKQKSKKQKTRQLVKKGKAEEDDQNLHPSWLAKKAQKERETSSVAFVGKKTTFDDD